MIAYKGFNKDLSCTRGKGTFFYKIGETYEEPSAKCANTGFHCVEEPIEVLTWYRNDDSRYCVVDADGDIHEDGNDKISCTRMKILKEVTLQQLAAMECIWIQEHPDRECSKHVKRNKAEGTGIVIVRGKNPKAAADIDSTIYLLKEGKGKKEIEEIGIYLIDGVNFMPGTYYGVDGRKARCEKRN